MIRFTWEHVMLERDYVRAVLVALVVGPPDMQLSPKAGCTPPEG